MGREFGKRSEPSEPRKKLIGAGATAGGAFLPEIQRGIYRYCHISGGIYAQYRETTKKLVGVYRLVGDEFVECGVKGLVEHYNV